MKVLLTSDWIVDHWQNFGQAEIWAMRRLAEGAARIRAQGRDRVKDGGHQARRAPLQRRDHPVNAIDIFQKSRREIHVGKPLEKNRNAGEMDSKEMTGGHKRAHVLVSFALIGQVDYTQLYPAGPPPCLPSYSQGPPK
ncbi:hypothetical protein COCMIDRAFT_29289 [Bipolaris oryzae ATCC 44560]|uniref:Uncharacterized protein n=1 Tax=Bipolaris oryzae ATCC 44560 TaxID=930090 RepID=W6YWX0_COCMI|nr:uncharacterized protein COCMIDRAFT_29289 [Bipolaris oryzae ATCC 44560]EUC42018.1 hypothetical protein COCMIDRAFT_29289 [Bipolaris oryzae ATCC 44560]